MALADNLSGTQMLAAAIDTAAREAAQAGRLNLAENIAAVEPVLARADLSDAITSLQGRIGVADYLRTRCIEAVVHGLDLTPPVEPDDVALAVTAESLLAVLRAQTPDLLPAAQALPARQFIDIATGRTVAPPALRAGLPVLS